MFTDNKSSYNTTLKIASYFSLALFVFIAGIISSERLLGIGADYDGYIDIFVQKGFVRDSVEPAYRVLRYLNDTLFGGNVSFVYFISVLAALFLKIRAFRTLSPHMFTILCLYMLSFFFIHEYTQIRAAVAIGIFLCSIKDIEENRPVHYFVKMVLATLFHYSAIIMIFCWVYVRIVKHKKYCLIITVSGLLYSLLFTEFASTLTDYIYITQELMGLNKSGGEADFISTWNLKYLVLLLLFIYLSKIIKEADSLNFTLYKIFSFALCCFYYLLPIQLPVITVRISEFYSVVFIILLVNIAYSREYSSIKKGYLLLFTSLAISVLYGYAAMKTITII